MRQEITVVLVDDDLNTLNLLENWLTHSCELPYGFKILGKARLGSQAIEILKTHSPDLLILDLQLPDMNGMEIALFAKDLPAPPRILLFSGYDDWLEWKDTAHHPIQGYMLKGTTLDQLEEALDKILKGGICWDPSVYVQMHQKSRASSEQEHWKRQLSTRELDILSLLRKGHKQAQIASELNLSINTVKTYLRRIAKKADCQRLDELKN
ncbi:hypothetical protein COW36_24160 [bacterium (Candidatus Blackallbacteria) CG17_big_fil_post_rev_8_21_14_2_50_48_46]|uniref:DNA-binding response regulator n=1 Tax=bacterium (Candidatus Blackallbacteria) CG17_big_fil_post_rev_8_21_14_2_50_48_46 TaxID=2014261 RepID=A0A2M7FXA2_9BACT|nr:MAG: hypothetical protein COW64_19100 [bacterium (Candidatus Blackallbacteria) CG18_big_fil_WC_8_21_14_2_50_49_26]PIW13765.1 MAG: hypothetical protein COW36_24160 [bacterium (Candidatus Blackallbacteria) CG17_big_fil_post_rev_8_21_14_2_50_48_46]PIW44991.1 MAG: hypothetical protein COW20_21790 [bacterium (Candidatus Blackallbacteria) CG13_big_fil_rev_8_21_14_2_50_49_14]